MVDYSYQDAGNAALYEPRITFIKRQLESLLRVVDLEKNGEVVRVDGFRLKDLGDWLVPSGCDPIEIFGYLGSRCNADCVFCYNRGNPPAVALGNLRRAPDEEFDEILTRLNHFSTVAGNALFCSLGDIYEILMHPRAVETLRRLREKTPKVFRINTNGIPLTPPMISALQELHPVYLYLSLNTASMPFREALMKDKTPQRAIPSPRLLKEAKIPYAMVIVPWPLHSLDEMLDNLSRTAAYAEENSANIIQLNLPGYTGHFSKETLFDLDQVWPAIVERARALRKTIETPIVLMPGQYEENLYHDRLNQAMVIGLVKNSPVERAGLMKEDLLLEINGLPVRSRPQARDLLSLVRESGAGEITLTVRRGRDVISLRVDLSDADYPYSPDWDNHLGVIFMGTGLRLEYLEKLRNIIDDHRAERVLFLSSRLVRPLFEQLARDSLLLSDRDLKIEITVPQNRFFGGNVFMGDLLVVQDFIDCINQHLAEGKSRPDLVVIPSSPFSLGPWKRDLTGRVYLDIEREVGIPVALLECMPICD